MPRWKLLASRSKVNIRTIVIVAFLIILTAAVSSYVTLQLVPTPKPVKTLNIGLVESLSGGDAFTGIEALNGAKMAVEEINSAGGIVVDGDRYLLNLIAEDGGGDPTVAVNAMNLLITQYNVVAVIGDTKSGVTRAMIPVAEQNKIPLITGISAIKELTNPGNQWFFRTNNHAGIEADAFVKFIVDVRGHRNVAVIAINDDFGQGSAQTYVDVLKKFNGNVKGPYFYDTDQTDFSSIIINVKNDNPDAILMISNEVTGALLVKQMRQQSITVEIFGTGTAGTPQWNAAAGTAAEGIYVISGYDVNLNTTGNAQFVANYRRLYGNTELPLPGDYAAHEYVNVYVIAEAIKRAQSINPSDIRDAMTRTDMDTIVGRIVFDGKYGLNQAHGGVAIAVVVAGGGTKLAAFVPG